MNSFKYTDVSIDDVNKVSPYVETPIHRYNISNSRALVRWLGETNENVILCCSEIRSHQEALDYYNNPINGWTPIVIFP